ncbi:MAG TPA: ABC transporter ATP-binding protein [Burkholderiales bacterium]|nr:ABC transporter ATP-binding protein [Burkholderiales bacterium]
MTADTATLLSVRDLKVDFRTSEPHALHALKGISFDIPARGTIALVGESGSGKSVTALAILGLLPAANATVLSGSSITYRGRNLLDSTLNEMQAVRGTEISMVFQEPMSSLNPVFSAGFQLGEVLRKKLGLTRRQARTRAVELLREVGIPEPELRVDAYPFQLSGGQQQRVMIAMAIACEPKLLIADEPTTALDVTVEKQILKLVAGLQRQRQMAMLFITHDLALVAEVADYVVVMREGEIREQGSVKRIFEAPRDDYTRALLACRPTLGRRPRRLPVIDDFAGGRQAVEIPERPRGLRGDEEIVLEARHLAKSFYFREGLFGRKAFEAVKDASFKLARGKTLGVVGESGSGKTTMALTLMRLTPASGGEVLFDGRNLLAMPPEAALQYKRRTQIVFQNPYASLNPRFTAGEILVEPMRIHSIGADDHERHALAGQLFDKVGLPQSSFFKYPHEFSGGQRQRIAIARCLTMKPDVLICDEAVSALDVSVQAQLLNLLQDLQDEYGISYVFISHDLAVVKYMADEVMVMKAGEIVEIAGSDEIYANPRHPYTKQLISAMPRGWRDGGARAEQ